MLRQRIHVTHTDRLGGSAKSRNRSFCVLRKSKTGNFSVVTLRVATLKIPGLVFFVIHQKFSTGTFGTAARLHDPVKIFAFFQIKLEKNAPVCYDTESQEI